MNIFIDRPNTIIKLGGSLFNLPGLADHLLKFLAFHDFESPLILPGGGRFADVIRNLDQTHSLDVKHSHELGIKTLALSAQFVAGLSPKFRLIFPTSTNCEIDNSTVYSVVDPTEFVLNYSPLPPTWDVTSDSIAAWLTSLHPQSNLVLLKSVRLPNDLSLCRSAELNLVDAEFPKAAAKLQKISWCNFRDDERELNNWRQSLI